MKKTVIGLGIIGLLLVSCGQHGIEVEQVTTTNSLLQAQATTDCAPLLPDGTSTHRFPIGLSSEITAGYHQLPVFFMPSWISASVIAWSAPGNMKSLASYRDCHPLRDEDTSENFVKSVRVGPGDLLSVKGIAEKTYYIRLRKKLNIIISPNKFNEIMLKGIDLPLATSDIILNNRELKDLLEKIKPWPPVPVLPQCQIDGCPEPQLLDQNLIDKGLTDLGELLESTFTFRVFQANPKMALKVSAKELAGSIFDLTGKELQTAKLENGSMLLPMNKLAAGQFYLLRLQRTDASTYDGKTALPVREFQIGAQPSK